MNEPLLQRAKQHRCVRLGSLRGKTNFIGITGKKAPSSLDLPELWHPCRVCSLVIDRPFYGVPPPPRGLWGAALAMRGPWTLLGQTCFWRFCAFSRPQNRTDGGRHIDANFSLCFFLFVFLSAFSNFFRHVRTSLFAADSFHLLFIINLNLDSTFKVQTHRYAKVKLRIKHYHKQESKPT